MDDDVDGTPELLAVQPLSADFSGAARPTQRAPAVSGTLAPLSVPEGDASLQRSPADGADLASEPIVKGSPAVGPRAPLSAPKDIIGSHFSPADGTDISAAQVVSPLSAVGQTECGLGGHSEVARRSFKLKREENARLSELRRRRIVRANRKGGSTSSFIATIVGQTAGSADPGVIDSAAATSPPASEASSGNSTSRSSSEITPSPESESENHDVMTTSRLASTDTAAAVASGAPPRLSANTTRTTGSSAAPRSLRLHAVQSSLFAYPSGDGWNLLADCSCGGSVCRSILSSNDPFGAAEAIADSAVTPESFVLMAASQGVSACNFDARRSPFRIGPEVVVDVPSFIRGTSPAPCSVTRLAAGNRPAVIMSGIAGVINISTEFVAAFRRRSCGWTSPLRIFVADSPLC